jgi:hypothetical protein
MISKSPALRTRFATSLAVWSFFAFALTKLIEPMLAPYIITYAIFLLMSVCFIGYFWSQYRHTLTFSEFSVSIVGYNIAFVILQFIYNWLFVIKRFQDWSWLPRFIISDLIFAGVFYLIFRLIKPAHRAK